MKTRLRESSTGSALTLQSVLRDQSIRKEFYEHLRKAGNIADVHFYKEIITYQYSDEVEQDEASKAKNALKIYREFIHPVCKVSLSSECQAELATKLGDVFKVITEQLEASNHQMSQNFFDKKDGDEKTTNGDETDQEGRKGPSIVDVIFIKAKREVRTKLQESLKDFVASRDEQVKTENIATVASTIQKKKKKRKKWKKGVNFFIMGGL
mmetsp:Transcript_16257/g.18086  ORF Transcript_16257/g.18086 Transcript_16257/m.18086 type:complete len:210 (-) Transcript_16257:42-671(-)